MKSSRIVLRQNWKYILTIMWGIKHQNICSLWMAFQHGEQVLRLHVPPASLPNQQHHIQVFKILQSIRVIASGWLANWVEYSVVLSKVNGEDEPTLAPNAPLFSSSIFLTVVVAFERWARRHSSCGKCR